MFILGSYWLCFYLILAYVGRHFDTMAITQFTGISSETLELLNYWFNAKRKDIINCDEKCIFNFTRTATSSQLCLLVQKFYKLVESSRVNTVRYICLLHIDICNANC